MAQTPNWLLDRLREVKHLADRRPKVRRRNWANLVSDNGRIIWVTVRSHGTSARWTKARVADQKDQPKEVVMLRSFFSVSSVGG